MKHKLLIFIVTFPSIYAYAESNDPRLAIPKVKNCVEIAEGFLSTTEYTSEDQKLDILKACRNADPDCVRIVGESLSSYERSKAKLFLPVIKACKGEGTGNCYQAIKNKLPSYEYSKASQALDILKKCE